MFQPWIVVTLIILLHLGALFTAEAEAA